MSWQKLKNKLARPFVTINDRVNRFVTYLQKPLHLFRFVAILLVVDFIAFMSLTRSSYAQMLNPVAFLFVGSGEAQGTMELYFPRSLSLTGIEKIYPEENTPAGAAAVIVPGAPDRKGEERLLDDAQVAGEVILIKKRISKPRLTDAAGNPVDKTEATARRVIAELIAGPSGELETLKARNLLKEPLFLRSAWTYEGTLYLSTQKSVWDKMTPNEVKITTYCIDESLKKNLPGAKFVLLKE